MWHVGHAKICRRAKDNQFLVSVVIRPFVNALYEGPAALTLFI